MAACGDTGLACNQWDWIAEMDCGSYIGLLAHSCMNSEEYHFKASASSLLYIIASMLWYAMSRGGQLCVAFSQTNEMAFFAYDLVSLKTMTIG